MAPPSSGNQVAHPFYQQPSLKRADSEARKLYEAHKKELDRHIHHARLPDADREQCRRYVGCIQVHRTLLVDTYEHLAYCQRRDQRLLSLLEGLVSYWGSWNGLRQLTHHAKIRDTLYNLVGACQNHRPVAMVKAISVLRADEGALLYRVVHCGRSDEAGFYGLASKAPITDRDNAVPWKESDVVIDLLYRCLTHSDEWAPVLVSRLRTLLFRLSRKSIHLPSALAISATDITYDVPLPAGSSAQVVYLARRAPYNLPVVVKAMRFPGDRNKFMKQITSEAILWSTLRHDSIVPFQGVIDDRPNNRICLVSTFMRNGTIHTYLKRNPLANRRSLAWNIAGGLAYLHNLDPPLYHGDLKPDNVLVDDTGHARLCDFGQAFAPDSRGILDTSNVGRPETPFKYMAPELLPRRDSTNDTIKVTSYSDMYAFGCILYEIVTNRGLFSDCSPTTVMDQIRHGEMPQRPGDVRSGELAQIWDVIEKCWQMSPRRRPNAQTAEKLLR